MITRIVTGRASIIWIVIVLGLGVLKFALREHSRKKEQSEALMAEFAPAFQSMTSETLQGSDWILDGPLGKAILIFQEEGGLEVDRGGEDSQGAWAISDGMLSLRFTWSEHTYVGIFRDSVDEILGVSPSEWRAKRVVE